MRALVARSWRLLAGAAGVVVAAMHAGLLWRRVVDGTLWAPLVVAEWLFATALLVLVVALRRRGISVFRGRAGAAFWIVVALMHGMVALPGGPGFVGVLTAAPATAALPLGFGLVVGALALLAALGLLAERLRLSPIGTAGLRSIWFGPAACSVAPSPRGPPA